MNEAERTRLTLAHMRDNEAEWAAYLARPWQDRAADQDKVEAAYQVHGVQAAWDMMQALGMPLPPGGMWDPVEELEAKRAAGTENDWLYEAMARFGVSREEVEALLAEPPAGRVDH